MKERKKEKSYKDLKERRKKEKKERKRAIIKEYTAVRPRTSEKTRVYTTARPSAGHRRKRTNRQTS